MTERTGPVQAQDRADDDPVQATYARFIRHVSRCIECRTQGVDCEDAAELRQAWRAARQAVTAA